MKTKSLLKLSIATIVLFLLAMSGRAVDLLERYPTQLTKGDADADHARPWEFNPGDIFQVSHFTLKVGDGFKVETGAADLGIGHCADGAVWAVLLPRDGGTLTSPVSDKGEPIANVWLRFHPAQINQIIPPETVVAAGHTNLLPKIQSVADAKFHSSWHAGNNAMIPEPKDITVYIDTTSGAHRFFMVDAEAQKAEYVAAFNRRSSATPDITPTSVPPVVVKTVPESGAADVPAGEYEVRVTFSKAMTDGSWSWCSVWDDSCPEGTESPKYDADHKTCAMKVKLEPGKTYGFWLNTGRFQNFRDTEGHSAVPYLLVFSTGGQGADLKSATERFVDEQLKQAQGGNYWAKFNLWEGYAQGTHDMTTNSAEAKKWLAELVKDAYLAKFEPVNGFDPKTPEEMLTEFSDRCRLFSGKGSLGGASFFRTTKQNGKLIGSFLTATPDQFKTAIERDPNFKLISIEKITPEMFLAHEASEQESL
jgi:hypothetical protein